MIIIQYMERLDIQMVKGVELYFVKKPTRVKGLSYFKDLMVLPLKTIGLFIGIPMQHQALVILPLLGGIINVMVLHRAEWEVCPLLLLLLAQLLLILILPYLIMLLLDVMEKVEEYFLQHTNLELIPFYIMAQTKMIL